jgi:hypothetical protein
MKLTNATINAMSNKLDGQRDQEKTATKENTATVLSWVGNEQSKQVFLTWLTAKSKPVIGETDTAKHARQQSNKNFQNVINKSEFQRQYFDLPLPAKLDRELRVKKATSTMVTAGIAEQSDVDSKKYFMWERDIVPTSKTAKEILAKVKKDFGLTNKQLSAIANTLD